MPVLRSRAALLLAASMLAGVPLVAGCGGSASSGAKSSTTAPSSNIPIPANASPAIRTGGTLVSEAANAGQVIVALDLSGVPCTRYHVGLIDRQNAPGPIQTATCVVANRSPALEIAIYASSADTTASAHQALACQRARAFGMTSRALLVVEHRATIQIWNTNQQAALVRAGLGVPIAITCA